MRRTLIVAALALLSMSGSAMAAGTTAAQPDTAKAACQDQKQLMGTLVFKKTYGVKSTAKAMAACIAKAEPVVAAATENAAKTCKAERDANADAFNEKYGTNKNKKNAFGKCVSALAKAQNDDGDDA